METKFRFYAIQILKKIINSEVIETETAYNNLIRELKNCNFIELLIEEITASQIELDLVEILLSINLEFVKKSQKDKTNILEIFYYENKENKENKDKIIQYF